MGIRLRGWGCARAAALALTLSSVAHRLRAAWASRAPAAILPTIFHRLAEFVALGGRDCVAHVKAEVHPRFFEGELRGADVLQLAVDCGAIRLIGGEQVFQVDALDLEVGAVANLGLAKIGFLLANLSELIVSDADLLANGRITQG
ncbi:MAG: hypothetical protein WBQ63_02365, partial [Candidatus Acidiferrales bacterium]